MKNKTKLGIGLAVALVVIVALVFTSNKGLFKGVLTGITKTQGGKTTDSVTLRRGKIILVDKGPVAQNIAVNSTNLHLFDFSLTSDTNARVQDYYVWLEQTAFDGTKAHALTASAGGYEVKAGSISTAGVCSFTTDHDQYTGTVRLARYDVVKITSRGINYYCEVIINPTADTTITPVLATLKYPAVVSAMVTFTDSDNISKVFDSHLRTYVKNLKLIDKKTGGILASTTNSSYINAFSDDFDLIAGKTRNLAILVDLDSTLAANNAFKGGVDFAESSFIKDLDTNEFIAASDVVGGNIFGKTMTAVR